VEDRGSRADLKRLLDILRSVTTAVQILPFIYSSLYIAALIAYNYIPEDAQLAMDSLLYVSPICIIAFLMLSKTLRMCRWHRIACSIPAMPLIVNFFDYYVISFSETFVYTFNYVIALMCVLLLIAAYKVFIK
jgi:hypothetical protein